MRRSMLRTATLVLTCFLIDGWAGRGLPIPNAPPYRIDLRSVAKEPGLARRELLEPSYRIDLRSVVKGPLVFEPIGPREPRSGILIRSVCFLDDQRLAATVVTPGGGKPGLATRGQPNEGSPFQLNAALIEADSGKIIATPEWPSNSRYAWIIAANDKGFVIKAGNEITQLSPQLTPGKRISLPQPPSDEYSHDRSWNTDSSWSGRRALLFAGRAWSDMVWVWLDTENFRILASWYDDTVGPIAVSDDQLVKQPFSQHFGDPPRSLMVQTPGAEWKPIPSTLYGMNPQFVGPNLLRFGIYAPHDRSVQSGVFLMRIDDGEISRVEHTRKGWGYGQAAVSRTGKRFVILVLETRGSHPSLDIGGHAVLRGFLVYDAPFHAASYTLEVRHSRLRNPDMVALSPDGRHLAICSYPEPVLEVFNLPPAAASADRAPRVAPTSRVAHTSVCMYAP